MSAREHALASLAAADDATFRRLNEGRDLAIAIRVDGAVAVLPRERLWALAQQTEQPSTLGVLEHELPSMHAWCVVGCADGTRELFVCDLGRGLLLDGVDAMPIARAA